MAQKHLGFQGGKTVKISSTGLVIALVAATLLTGAPTAVRAAVDEREMRAREAFAVGKYQEALDLFAKLYAEKLHPNYLRNIGRCYQNLGDPDRAISSFREYLRKAKTVNPDERQEVEGYIKEMEDLKAKRQTATTPATGGDSTGAASAGATAGSTTTGQPAGGGATTAPNLNLTQSAQPVDAQVTTTGGGDTPAAPEGAPPFYQRWWFWAIVGGVVVAGLGTAAALGAFTSTQDAPCPNGVRC